jgi:hypothetical protein
MQPEKPRTPKKYGALALIIAIAAVVLALLSFLAVQLAG